jgi:outer membrane protein OmpA-like peptidoglycan-associated protein
MTKGLLLVLLLLLSSFKGDKYSYRLNDILFEINSDKLDNVQIKELEVTIKTIRAAMNEGGEKTFTLWINGHADSSEKNAKRLSNDRAKTIKEEIVKLGLTEGTLITKGYGTTRPLTSSKTDAEKRRNARVEFKIKIG